MNRRCLLLAFCCVFWVMVDKAGGQQATLPAQREEESLIKIGKVNHTQQHPLTLEEIVATRRPVEPQISPDGETVAYVVQQAFLHLNKNRSALFVLPAKGGREPVKLLEEASLSMVRWSPDAAFITYLSGKSGTTQVWRIDPKTGGRQQLTNHATAVREYAWSADGSQIAFLATRDRDTERMKRDEEEGVVFDETLDYRDIIYKSWAKQPHELWVFNLKEGSAKLIWESSLWGKQGKNAPLIPSGIVWAPDGRKIAMAVVLPLEDAPQVATRHIGIVTLGTRKFEPIITWNGINSHVSWLPDSTTILFRSEGDIDGKTRKYQWGMYAAELAGGKSWQLSPQVRFNGNQWSSPDGRRILFELSDFNKMAMYEVLLAGGSLRKITRGDDHLHSASMNADRTRVACIRENSMTPPEVAVYDVNDGVLRTLTDLNPEYRNIRLGEVTFLTWQNKSINQGQGYLTKPLGYVPGKRYPLLVILFGFHGGFIWQAQWFPNYPVQVFAAEGYAVLMVNPPMYNPGYSGWRPGDFAEGSRTQAFGPLESIKNGVKKVVEMGIADPRKTGIMGWSYGAFLADLAITQGNDFRVASSGDGGSYNPGTYYLVNSEGQKVYEDMYGGSPYGAAKLHWDLVAPAQNAGRVQCPVLMEYIDKNLTAFEFFTALKKQGKQVELVFYPGATHLFSQPRQRFSSMQRNIDWFNFWLHERKDPLPDKNEQYIRWDAMRKALREAIGSRD